MFCNRNMICIYVFASHLISAKNFMYVVGTFFLYHLFITMIEIRKKYNTK